MIAGRSTQKLCQSCSYSLLSLFTYGLSAPKSAIRLRAPRQSPIRTLQARRPFAHTALDRRENDEYTPELPPEDSTAVAVQRLEDIARLARQTFGEKLPQDFLSQEEYHVYERLYGPPTELLTEEDLDIGNEVVDDTYIRNALLREGQDGTLEEVVYDEDEDTTPINDEELEGLDVEIDDGLPEAAVTYESELEFLARVEELRQSHVSKATEREVSSEEDGVEEDVEEALIASNDHNVEEYEAEDDIVEAEEEDDIDYGATLRSHPLTVNGRSGSSPSTISIPKEPVLSPITDFLANVSNRKLVEVAHSSFGGPDMPHSTSTIFKHGTRQQTIGLDAFQHLMKEMEGNAFFAAILPGAYASISSILIEIRKRLGGQWLRSLMQQEGGPRILDAGSGCAGVLAWREILKAEFEASKPVTSESEELPPYGKSTVVTGSPVLRHKASKLLDNTTFIPRLPDYDPARDHPSLEGTNPQPRKQYDIIIASYSLWQLREDHMRKSQVQNFWSLLEPRGGVLILLEKGIPKGFELIAGAREALLKHHVASADGDVQYPVQASSENRFGAKEKAMIIAPCTNHGKCPMYIDAGRSQGRKDYCHFSQRYQRPQFLQRLSDKKKHNHEDVKFSYVAFQRGADQRQDTALRQGKAATDAAFAGYEGLADDAEIQNFNTLSLPRNVLPPIKRKGHVSLDLCTPAGRIERWTVPKSFSKQAYRDARKAQWGDLWALGAKTRVLRRIRVGRTSAEGEIVGQDRNAAETADQDPDATKVEEPEVQPVERKRKKARKPKHKRLLMEGKETD